MPGNLKIKRYLKETPFWKGKDFHGIGNEHSQIPSQILDFLYYQKQKLLNIEPEEENEIELNPENYPRTINKKNYHDLPKVF